MVLTENTTLNGKEVCSHENQIYCFNLLFLLEINVATLKNALLYGISNNKDLFDSLTGVEKRRRTVPASP